MMLDLKTYLAFRCSANISVQWRLGARQIFPCNRRGAPLDEKLSKNGPFHCYLRPAETKPRTGARANEVGSRAADQRRSYVALRATSLFSSSVSFRPPLRS